MQLWAETGTNLSGSACFCIVFFGVHLNSGFMVKGRWQKKAGKCVHWMLETCFEISVLVLRWITVEAPFPFAGATVTEGFLGTGKGGLIVRWYSMEIKVRMDQASLFILLPYLHFTVCPNIFSGRDWGGSCEYLAFNWTKSLTLREAGGCLSLSEVKEKGEANFSISCVWHGMAGVMGQQLGAACFSFPTWCFRSSHRQILVKLQSVQAPWSK